MFRIEFYDSGDCYRCKKATANIHLARTARERIDRDYIDLCWKCWSTLNDKVKQAFNTRCPVS